MKTDPTSYSFSYGSRTIGFSLTRTDRKRLRIVVKPDLAVRVVAPLNAKDEDILKGVQGKAAWIARSLDHLKEYHPLPSPKQYISGESFTYLGRHYRLKVFNGEPAPAKLKGGYLEVTVLDKKDIKTVRKAVDHWFRIRADDVFNKHVKTCQQVASRHGIPNPVISLRKMRTRWGSCSSKGRVTLNLNLIQVPVHCIEYVIMHELCHLKHHNHSPAFYRLLSRCMPDWKQRKAVLDKIALP